MKLVKLLLPVLSDETNTEINLLIVTKSYKKINDFTKSLNTKTIVICFTGML